MEVTVSYLFDVTENYQFKAKNLEIKKYPLCLGNTSKDFTIDNLKKKTGLKESANFFSVDYRSVSTNEIFAINKYLMKKLL